MFWIYITTHQTIKPNLSVLFDLRRLLTEIRNYLIAHYTEEDALVIMQRNPSYDALDKLGAAETEASGTYVVADEGVYQSIGMYGSPQDCINSCLLACATV